MGFHTILLEPAGKNTAPAVLTKVNVLEHNGDALLLVMPSIIIFRIKLLARWYSQDGRRLKQVPL